MSISFKPTKRNLQTIRDILTQATNLNPDDLQDDTLNNIIQYCWNTFTDNNRYAVAAQYWRGQNPPDQQHQRILVGYYKTIKQAENAAKQFHWNTRLQQQWKTWILPVHNGTVSEHFTNQKTLLETNTSGASGHLPEHLQNVMCGQAINHPDGAITWCTRKPGHDGDCRTGWQPCTQPKGKHGNQN